MKVQTKTGARASALVVATLLALAAGCGGTSPARGETTSTTCSSSR